MIWNIEVTKRGGFYMFILKCFANGIDPIIPNFTKAAIDTLKVLIPVILVVLGMIDLAKAVIGNDEKVMKEAQSRLIKRVIYAVVIFFIVAIVQFVFSVLANAQGSENSEVDSGQISSCITCFISNPKEC